MSRHIVTLEVSVAGAMDHSQAGQWVTDLLNKDINCSYPEIVDVVEVDAHTGWPVGPEPLKGRG